MLDLPMMPRLLNAMGQELRHRKVSLFLGGQKSSNVPSDLLAQVSMLFLFQMESRYEIEKVKELRAFRHVSCDQVFRLKAKEALLGASQSTDPLLQELAQLVRIRPTLIDAGGETMTA